MRDASTFGAALLLLACGPTTVVLPPVSEPVEAPRPSRATTAAPPRPSGTAIVPPVASARPTVEREIVIYDDTTSTDPKIETVPQAEQSRILRKLFPKYLTDAKQCSPNITSIDDSRRRGEMVPRVVSAASGSFTAAGVSQRLYLVFVGECGASHADNFGSGLVVTFQNDAIVARAVISGSSSIERLFDLDGDGRLELLITSGFMNQGAMTMSASLDQVGATSLTTLKDFGEVLTSNCAGAFEPKQQEVSIIRALTSPGHAPTFRVTKKKGPCQ